MVSRISRGSSSDTRREENNGCSYITVSGVANGRYTDIAVLSDFSDESDEADRTQLVDGRSPETDQPVVILEDIALLPVTGEYGRYFADEILALAMAEGYWPGSSMAWGDSRISPTTFKDSISDLLQEALTKDENAFIDGGCPRSVGRFIRSMRLSEVLCTDRGCTSAGCACYNYKNQQLNGFLEDITLVSVVTGLRSLTKTKTGLIE